MEPERPLPKSIGKGPCSIEGALSVEVLLYLGNVDEVEHPFKLGF